ncbi:MAG: cytochrome c1 [Gammaproteobacteria bacterium HGW-Gammaproteobacteria-8]|nr:MAG: cytochrome c1 [Gammaproteobacteria bacterium HGW-Gammaproteobacteria-8]
MMRILAILALCITSLASWAAGGGEQLRQSGANVHDITSVQSGATLFANYCHSCHSAEYMRYQRLAQDLEITEQQVEEFLIFSDAEITDYMKAAMPAEAANWMGKKPPDLSLTARSRGADWIYSFLSGFYMTADGWNNTVLANASMPHVLWELQGIQRPIMESYTDEAGQQQTRIKELRLDQPGSLTPDEYDTAIRDITAFMIYLGEPSIIQRERMGIWVLLFLVVFTFLAYLLYKEYWRDVKK